MTNFATCMIHGTYLHTDQRADSVTCPKCKAARALGVDPCMVHEHARAQLWARMYVAERIAGRGQHTRYAIDAANEAVAHFDEHYKEPA